MGHNVKNSHEWVMGIPEGRKEHGPKVIFEGNSWELSEIHKWQQATDTGFANVKQNKFKEDHT